MKHKTIVRTGFNQISGFYDFWYDTPLGAYADRVEKRAFHSFLKSLPSNTLILDLGTGTGVLLQFLLQKNFEVIGIDFSKDMIKKAKKKIGQRQGALFIGDIENLPFQKETFDIVTAMTTLEFVENVEKLLYEIWRVLKSGGKFILGVLTSLSTWSFDRKIRGLVSKDIFSYAKFYTSFELIKLLRSAKFSKIDIKGAVFAPPFIPKRFFPFVEKIEQKFMDSFILRMIGAFLVVKAKKI
ncbi:MAG: class I SAM-dependent methyltransferase [Promethearchaeota archaeon]